MLERFRNTISRVKGLMEAWQESGKAGLYKPKVISRHQYGYRPWLEDCLNASRVKMAPLGAEELDRVTCVAFWRGYVDSTGRALKGDTMQDPTDQVLVDVSIDLHEKVMESLYKMGLFEMFKDDSDKLRTDAQQPRRPGATLLIAINELWKPAPVAAVVQFMKNDPTRDDMGEISDVDALRRRK